MESFLKPKPPSQRLFPFLRTCNFLWKAESSHNSLDFRKNSPSQWKEQVQAEFKPHFSLGSDLICYKPTLLGLFFCQQKRWKNVLHGHSHLFLGRITTSTDPFWVLICLKDVQGCPILTDPNLFSTVQFLKSEKAINFMVKYRSVKIWDYDISCLLMLHYWETETVKVKIFLCWSPVLQ